MYTPQAADNVRISRTDHAASLQTPGTRRSSKGDGCDGCCKPSAHAERAKWTMDEATTVRRMACSAPPPTPLHPQPPRPAPQIFVSIVSYRDPECARTVLDLFLSAAQPERLSVALVQQHATWQQHRAAGQGAAEPAGGADGDCMDLVESVAPEFGAQVRRVVMRPEEARGPVLARNLSRGLYAGEHYALSIDSHMRFGCEWDSRLVALLLALNHSRALVTAYPPNYSPMQGLQDAARVEPSRLVALGFHDLDALAHDAPAPASDLNAVGGVRAHGKRQSDRHRQAADEQSSVKILRIGSRHVPADECARRGIGAVTSLFWAAGFNFGRGTAVLEVPYDARLEDLFFGEEMLMSLLLWRSGYAFFAPCDPSMVWHQWSRAGRPTFWEQRRSTRPPAATLHRLHAALLSDAAQDAGGGAGGRRAGRAYEEFANVSFGCGVAGPRARAGLSPVWRP